MSVIIEIEKVEKYQGLIVKNWNKVRESIIEVGLSLIEAKENLSREEWRELVEKRVPFSKRTADRLMAIAKDPKINSGTHASKLPNSWATLYEISKMTDEEFNDAITKEVISPESQRKDITKFINEKRGTVQTRETGDSTEYPETIKIAFVYINPEKLTSSDDLNKFKKSIQDAISGILYARVDFSEFEEKIYSKWEREQVRDVSKEIKGEELKAKRRLSVLIKEGVKKSGGRKKFEYGACSSIRELREMPVDKAINILGDDQFMFRDLGKSISTVEHEVSMG